MIVGVWVVVSRCRESRVPRRSRPLPKVREAAAAVCDFECQDPAFVSSCLRRGKSGADAPAAKQKWSQSLPDATTLGLQVADRIIKDGVVANLGRCC